MGNFTIMVFALATVCNDSSMARAAVLHEPAIAVAGVPLAYESWSLESDSAAIWNNFANTCLERAGEDSTVTDTAIYFYRKAMRAAPEDGGITLNLAIAYLVKSEFLIADSLFRSGYEQSGSSLEKVYSLLGMDFEQPDQDKGTARSVTETELRERIAASAGSKKEEQKSRNSKTKESEKKKRPTRAGGPKSLDPREIMGYLYWRR